MSTVKIVSSLYSIRTNLLLRLLNSRDRLKSKLTPMNAASYCSKPLVEGTLGHAAFQTVISNPEIQFLADLFKKSNYEIRIAGGAVRDLLTGKIPDDVDFATNATPPQMIELMSQHEDRIRIIVTKRGKMHGTVTARIDGKTQYEVTTLRIDKLTNGRFSEVEFIKDWKLDSNRRDLTINSMFLDLDGMLYDFFDGEKDLRNKCVRFVGEPINRIQEDYLRILRYFRFYIRYGNLRDHHPETLSAIRDNLSGLKGISGERIWMELKKIVAHKNCVDVVPMMFDEIGFGEYAGFVTKSGHFDISEFTETHDKLWKLSCSFQPITLFTALMKNKEDCVEVSLRLRLSNVEQNTSSYIINNRNSTEDVSHSSLKMLLARSPQDRICILKPSVIEYLKYIGNEQLMNEINDFDIPKFPIRGTVLIKKVTKKKHISKILDELKMMWIRSDFEMSEEDLYSEIDNVVERIENKTIDREDVVKA